MQVPDEPALQPGGQRRQRRTLRRHFDAVRVSRSGSIPAFGESPLILFSNHPSWWDPILLMLVCGSLTEDAELYGPMDAAALERYGILRRLGVFGVERGTRAGLASFLRTCDAILERPRGTLCITAEGQFTDPRVRPVRLESGVAHVLKRHPAVAAIPVALEYPFWNERAPQALLRFGPPLRLEPGSRPDTDDLRVRMEAALTENLDALAAEAQARDPGAFESLVEGRKGVGGVYDVFRRVWSKLRGRKFDPAHSTVRREPD